MKIPLNFLLSLICGLISFLFGYRIGIEVVVSPPSVPLATPCPVLSSIEIENEDQKIPQKEIPSKETKTFYKLYKNSYKSVVDLVFDEYYHPSSMSKAEFVYSPLSSWLVQTAENKTQIRCKEMYHTRTGSRTNQPAKCVAIVTVLDGQHSPWMTSHRIGVTAGKTNQYTNDYTFFSDRKMDEQQLYPFLSHRDSAINQFLSKVGPPVVEKHIADSQHFDSRVINSTHVRRSIIVMVANEGVMNLLLNFICSCVSSGINPKSIVVFVGVEDHVSLMEELGVTAMFIREAGAMPREVASNYGDNIFGVMMWLKVTSVYIALHAGFDVLFQDADLVWFQDPLPDLSSFPHDISFMDDGARSGRFNPFFANSGFYFMKHNEFTLYLMEKMITAGVSEIHRTKSHQSVMTRYLMESIQLVGLEITILSQLGYPSGKMFHHNKTYMAQLRADQVKPKVFHMCWTANTQDKVSPPLLFSLSLIVRSDPPPPPLLVLVVLLLLVLKIQNFKSIDKWYLKDTKQCSDPSQIALFGKKKSQNMIAASASLLDSCCVNPRVYHGTVKLSSEQKSEESLLETEANEEK